MLKINCQVCDCNWYGGICIYSIPDTIFYIYVCTEKRLICNDCAPEFDLCWPFLFILLCCLISQVEPSSRPPPHPPLPFPASLLRHFFLSSASFLTTYRSLLLFPISLFFSHISLYLNSLLFLHLQLTKSTA